MQQGTAGDGIPPVGPPGLSALSDLQFGKIDGHARINGDSLHELRLDADITIKTGTDFNLHGYVLFRDLSSDTPASACRVAAGSAPAAITRTPHRLSAEQLRDSLLAVSGLLAAKHSGPPVWPELPAEVLQANPAFLDDNAEKTKGWYPSPKADQFVRSLFVVQKRTVKVPFMEIFDLPDKAVSCARRDQSIVAPQALTLLNGPLTIEAAKALAQRVQHEVGELSEAQVKKSFRFVLQRGPTRDEATACLKLLRQRSLPELCRALLNLNEFAYVD